MAASSALADISSENVASVANAFAENTIAENTRDRALVSKIGLALDVCVIFDKLILLKRVRLSTDSGSTESLSIEIRAIESSDILP